MSSSNHPTNFSNPLPEFEFDNPYNTDDMDFSILENFDTRPGHPYYEFPDNPTAQEKCKKLRTMDVGGHIHIDWDLLNELHEGDRCQEIIGYNTPWARLFDLATRPSYRELTVEFLVMWAKWIENLENFVIKLTQAPHIGLCAAHKCVWDTQAPRKGLCAAPGVCWMVSCQANTASFIIRILCALELRDDVGNLKNE
ncbi:hypothetical protein QVD17_26186 [Tagetes erecta]|uniref:Uncharacterized protein n=1 Tax=Tagetes erecta TaxID=13708 RepID=A0AAD8NPV9_TARER|nr:hypothetical protein QVD17_26186 [Tagetes erecta]